MGFVEDFFGDGEAIDFLAGGQADVLDLFGRQEAREGRIASEGAADAERTALERSIEETRRATEQGLGFLEPFGQVGQRGVEESSFLANPEEQFAFLQNNPLFKMALDNANQQTGARAAAGSRLSAGDTLEQLSNNVLLSASPLIDRQRQDIGNLLNIGTGIAQTQANTAIGQGSNVAGFLTDIGNVNAAGIAGSNQARQQGRANARETAGTVGSFFASDSRLKNKPKIIGNKNGYNIWEWEWNEKAKELFNLVGKSMGVMYSEVLEKAPEATITLNGHGIVNYDMIGIEHAS